MNYIGIDIGGTKTSVSVANDHGKIAAADRIPMKSLPSLDEYLQRLAALCHATAEQAGVAFSDIAAVGISAPGPLDVSKGVLIAPPNNPGWHNVPIVEAVKSRLDKPVFLNHDAKAAALAEYNFGGHGVNNLLYLTCSTGMGGGIVANGRIVQGVSDGAGEVGHHNVDINGPVCSCGKFGCWESYVGGRMVVERAVEQIRSGNIATSVVDKAGGRLDKIVFKMICDAAREGDPFAVQVWEEFTERMAQGIANLVMILNPELIVLGTIAIYEGDFLMAPLREKLKKYAWSWLLDPCRIIPSALGPHIGDLGALSVAMTQALPPAAG